MIVGLLLAAGGARRFGSQKLVASLDGEPIVRRAAATLASATGGLAVVVGNEASRVRAALRGLDPQIIVNEDWASGLATSIVAGIAALGPSAEAAVIALGDQPGLDARVVRAVIDEWRSSGRHIVAPRYRGAQGHPVLFARAAFGELSALEGDRGARPVIERDPSRVSHVDVDAAVPRDVDTLADLAALRAEGRVPE